MLLIDIEKYAALYNIPIMQKEGIEFLVNYIKENNITKILEIGTAIGYSAIKMALVSTDVKITTIERDEERYQMALLNIAKFDLTKQIEVIKGDALETEINGQFDLIFIDAAKSQYLNFFNKYNDNLAANGVVITDNINFHNLVSADLAMLSKNLRGLIKKLNLYIDFLKDNDNYETSFINIGDGLAISKKK